MRLFLISSSRAAGYEYLEYPKPDIKNFLGNKALKIAFVPFAGVQMAYEELAGYDAYEEKVRTIFLPMGYQLESIHRHPQMIKKADAIVVGGGNTFQLLKVLQERDLMEPIKQRVMKDKIPYVGWSAGVNIVCPTIGTTNDMPITEPQSFRALGLIPFQINPHYLDAAHDGHFGETREERILEFLEINRNVHVVGLREGTMLKIENSKIRYHGIADKTCRVFKHGQNAQELGSNDDFNFLLKL